MPVFLPPGPGGAGATNLSVTPSVTTITVLSDTGTDAVLPVATTSLSGVLSAADKTKLDGVATGATANATDSQLRDRATHTGAQAISTVTGLQVALDAKAALGSTAGAALGTAAAGVATTAARSDHVHPVQTTVSGNAGTATALATARNITLTGDVTGTASFTGAADASITTTIADDSHNHTTATVTGFSAAVDARIGAASVDALADVSTAGAITGQVLQWSGTQWVPAAVTGGSSSPINSAVVFVHQNGDDGTAVVGDPAKPYASVAAAIAGAGVATIFRLEGTFSCGKGPVTFPGGTTLVGTPGMTELQFDGSLKISAPDNGCCVQVAPGSTGTVRLYDITINVALSGTTLCAPIGATPSALSVFPDIELYRCRILGKTDALYLNNCTARIFAYDCYLESHWDIVYTGAAGQHIYIENSKLRWYPRNTANGLSSISWGVINNDGFVSIKGGSITYEVAGFNSGLAEAQFGGLNITGSSLATKLELGGGFKRINSVAGDAIYPLLCAGVGFGSASTNLIKLGEVDIDCSAYGGLQAALNAPPKYMPNGTKVLAFRLGAASLANLGGYWKCSAAATSQVFDLVTLPAGVIVEAVQLERRVAAGTVTTATIELGTSGNSTKYLAATDIKSTGTAVAAVNVAEGFGDPAGTAGTIIRVTVRSTGGNVSAITSADIVVRLRVSGGLG